MKGTTIFQYSALGIILMGLNIPNYADAMQVGDNVTFGGNFRLNYDYKDWLENSRSRLGDFGFHSFRLKADVVTEDWNASTEYRWYSNMDVIHHAWFGHNFSSCLTSQFGVTQVPFGVLPYATFDYWDGVPFYLGLSDDYEMGAKFIYDNSPWNLQVAAFKNDEWGDSSRLTRYSADLVRVGAQQNEKTNQLNGRIAYTFSHQQDNYTEFGISARVGQLYNVTEQSKGNHHAAAVHWVGHYFPWDIQFEVARYQYNVDNPSTVDSGIVQFANAGDAYTIPAKGSVALLNIGYTFQIDGKIIDNIMVYNDYSVLFDVPKHAKINTLGFGITSGSLHISTDLIMAKDMVFIGPTTNVAERDLAVYHGWNTRLNVHVTYSF